MTSAGEDARGQGMALGNETSTSAMAPTEETADPMSDPDRRARVSAIVQEIDLSDAASVITFGTRAQEALTGVSDAMLEGVRNKDIGPAGNALSDMLLALRGFDVKELDPNREPGLLSRLLGGPKPVTKFLQRYDQVRQQIDAIGDQLEAHKGELMVDIAQLDRLYEASLEYFHSLADYIVAGDEKLRQLDQDTLPALEREAAASGDVVKAQRLRDLRVARDDLERRVHDLKLTRQVTMQSLPSIRLVQENDKSLINKITSVIANTVPLWRTQLAQAVTIFRSREAGRTLKEATDLTNELLLANAENLRDANAEIRRQVERGVFDIEAVGKANAALIATIEDSLKISDEGKRMRMQAEARLQACEAELRDVLRAASARASAAPERRD